MNNEQLIQEQFEKLPKSLRTAIESIDWKSIVKGILSSYNLSADQAESVERETMLVIYGFENPLTYIDALVREVNLPENLAEKIANQIAKEVFDVISVKSDEIEKFSPTQTPALVPEVGPEIHPMIEEGEVAHEVPHQEQTTDHRPPTTVPTAQPVESVEPIRTPETQVSKTHYPGGIDPYREPLN